MVLRPRSITASCAGRGAACGRNLFRDLAVSGRSTDTQMIASTHVKAHRSAAGANATPHSMIHGDACFAYFNKIWGILGGGKQKQAVGRSREGRNTKIYALDAPTPPPAALLALPRPNFHDGRLP